MRHGDVNTALRLYAPKQWNPGHQLLTAHGIDCAGCAVGHGTAGAMAQTRLNLSGVSTLIVDSEQFTRGLVARMLRGFGMDPATQVADGAGAKQHLKHNVSDLILIDATL